MTVAVFEPRERPVLSVVMVTYGGGEWAERALDALRARTAVPFEVVIVDNASPDGTADRLAAGVSGATLIRNDRNVGYAAAANLGAARARAPFVCFLNPDALVEEGWDRTILDAFDDPTVGAAVPRLLDLDGRLQEAGSLVGRDGYTWALGHDDGDPADPAFAFPLEVDYGSACLVVRRTAFSEVGGFDPAFFPAYGEDVDLCLSLQERGWRVVHEPRARVRHVRSVSLGTGGAERWIHRSRARLVRRWGAQMRERPWLAEPAFFPHRVAAVRDHRAVDRVLVVGDRLADLRDVEEHLFALAARRDARVTTVLAAETDAHAARELAVRGVEVVLGPKGGPDWFEARRYQASAVVVGTRRFDRELDATQPQAPRVALESLSRDPAGALADAGVATAPGGT
ncbi:MAG TPA: glycosyltransferase family 2 protein [Actinomycetota bacterium]|nr:glycosyltransferase family 2 protein [Actinomycetota bacterium]